MSEQNLASALAYYKAMNDKDVPAMARHLHSKVRLISPMDELNGKAAVLKAAEELSKHIKGIKVHAMLGSEDQAMLTYDMVFAGPIGICRTAALMTFKDGLIARNELFFDARPFDKK